MNLSEISLSLYSFGYGAGFIKDDRQEITSPMDLSKLAQVALQHSLGGVEFPIDRLVPDGDQRRVADVIDQMLALGLRARIDLEVFDAEYLERLIPVVASRQLGFVRVKTSNFYGGNRYQHPELAHDLQILTEGLRKNLSALKDTGTRVLIENHQDIVMSDYWRLWDEFGQEHVGMTWDIGNSLPACERPLDLLAAAGPAIGNVHLKDYQLIRCDQGYRMVRCALGRGQIGLETIIPALKSQLPGVPLTIELGAMNTRTANIEHPDYWHAVPGKSDSQIAAFKRYVYSQCVRKDDWSTAWEQKLPPATICQHELNEVTESVQFLAALES
jgi:sugar phosphate isomerase/epimerase